jgi:hypothetical protein
VDIEGSADDRDPVSEAAQSGAFGAVDSTDAVVADLEGEVGSALGHGDDRLGGVGLLRDVG